MIELERLLAANDAEIKQLKKFDVKFYAEYDADLKPVGPAYDLLEWQANLQAQLLNEGVHHNDAKAQLAALRAENERLKSVEQHEPSGSRLRSLCVSGEADQLLRECDYHKTLRAGLVKSNGARMKEGSFELMVSVRDPGAMMSAILGHPCAGPETQPSKRSELRTDLHQLSVSFSSHPNLAPACATRVRITGRATSM